MKKMLLLTVAVGLAFFGFSQDISEALKLLNENKRSEAANKLQSNSSADAKMLLCLQAISNEYYDKAIGYYNDFHKISPDPYPYMYALWGTGMFSMSNSTISKEVKKLMEEVLKDPRANATILAMVQGNLAYSQYRSGDVKDSKETYKKMGDVRNWALLGGFENVSASGFNKDFGVLANPSLSANYKNKNGAPIQWLKTVDARNDRWLDFEFHYRVDNDILYAQTFVQSTDNQEVMLMTGVSGSMKIWLNDVLIGSESEERNTDLDVYNYEVKLQSGYNRLLIQIGESEISNANFMVRFVDKSGKLMNLNSVVEVQPYTKAAAYTAKKIPMFAENFFEQRLAKNPTSFLDLYCASKTYLRNDKRYEARKSTQQLKKLFPNSTLVSEVVVEAYIKDKNNTDLKKELEFIKSNDDESLYGYILRTGDAVEKEEYDEALKLLEQRERFYGVNVSTELKRLELLSKKKDNEKLLKLIESGAQKYPTSETFMRYKTYLFSEAMKDNRAAINYVKSYLDKVYDEDVVDLLIRLYFDNGQKSDAFKLHQKLLEEKPYAVGRINTVANKYYELQDYNKALEWEEKALAMAPYVGTYHSNKATMLEALSRKSDARDAYKSSILYSPTNYDSRKKLRELDGKKDLFSYFKEKDPYDLFKKSPAGSEYPNDNSLFLLNEQFSIVYPENGASEEKHRLLIKVFNQAGIERWKDVELGYNSYRQRLNIEKAETVKKDGSKIKAEIDDDRCVFTNLEVGDAILIVYKLENYYSGKLSEHFWDEFNFNGFLPMANSTFSLIVPTNRPFKYEVKNASIEPVITTIDDYKMYTWEKAKSPAIQSEDYMPPFDDIGERLVISSIPNWSYVANWYSDIASVKAKGDFEVKEVVQSIFGDKKNLTEMQKAKMIYEYIAKNFTYSNVSFLQSAYTPKRASNTISTKLGDCKDLSTLFVSMAKEVGLNANLVLVDTRDNGDNPMPLPYIGFNHCIAGLTLADGKKYLLELTDNRNPFGAMSWKLVNSNGLMIPKDGETTNAAALEKLDYKSRTMNFVSRISTINFEGANVTIDRLYRRLGAEASSTRNNWVDVGEEDRRKDFTSNLSSEFNKKITLKDLSLTNLDNLSDTVDMRYKFQVENATTELLGMQIFKIPWSDAYNTTNFVSLDKRTQPFNIWNFSSTPLDLESITILFPKGKKLAEVPKNVTLTCGALDYKLTFTVKPDRLVAVREMKYNKEVLQASEYPAFKDFISKVSEADSKPIGFK
jgi:tetratricopeptide (TPR) repeat protein